MHLSPLSEGFLADISDVKSQSRGRAHREGLLRGLAVLAIVGVLMSLGFISSDAHSDPAPTADDLIHCAVADR